MTQAQSRETASVFSFDVTVGGGPSPHRLQSGRGLIRKHACVPPKRTSSVILNVLSDLHLSRGALKIPKNDADLVILAGDVARPKEAVAWASGFAKPTLYVPGNHEFYGGSIRGTVDELKELCAGTHIHVLDNDEIIVAGVRFLGTTLWT